MYVCMYVCILLVVDTISSMYMYHMCSASTLVVLVIIVGSYLHVCVHTHTHTMYHALVESKGGEFDP